MRLLSIPLSALAVALLASPSARADACREIDAPIVTTYTSGCDSPVGVCTEGTVPLGRLLATTRFRALTLRPGATPEILLYTGELVLTTSEGSLTIHDAGVLNAATGHFFELERVVGGTRKYKHATGFLTSRGTATATGFAGTLTGAICHVDGEGHGK
jgi:hypothetical protein